MDEPYLYRALRYVERNPVRAGIVSRAEDYPWSSARAHIDHSPDPLLSDLIPRNFIRDWKSYLEEPDDDEFLEKMRNHSETGRPLGETPFLERLEILTGRKFLKKKRPI